MKKLLITVFLSFAILSLAQNKKVLMPVIEKQYKSYPIAGGEFFNKEEIRVSQFLKSNPGFFDNLKIKKTSVWGFKVGDQKQWYSWDLSKSPETSYLVPSTCRAVGVNCYVFVENTVWGTSVDSASVAAVVNEFDNRTPANSTKGIYQTDVDTFGNPPNVDNDPRIIILILDIKDGYQGTGGYVSGFFNAANEIGYNNAEIYYMDANPTNLETADGLNTALKTAAHEFQHMINWNYHKTNPEITFINEGLSMVAEIICGYPPSDQQLYANETNIPLTTWRGNDATKVLNDYGRAQRFFIYLNDQFGVGIFNHIVQDNLTGLTGMNSILQQYSSSFNSVFVNWQIANELNDRKDNSAYGYLLQGLPKSVGKTYFNPNVNLTIDTVQSLAAEYISFSGAQDLKFIPSASAGSLIIKALETGNNTSRVLDVPLNSTFSEPLYGTTYTTICFVVINLDQSANMVYNYQATGISPTTATELKWDNTEPVGYYAFDASDTVCVQFDSYTGGMLDSIRVALRKAGTITGGIYQFTGNQNPTPLGKPLVQNITASISTTNPPTGNPYPIPWQNWTSIDLRKFNIKTDNPFSVALVIGSDPSTPGVMVTDYPGTSAYHSYTYLHNPSGGGAAGWYYITSSDTTVAIYLIRAYVSIDTNTNPAPPANIIPAEFSLSQNYPNPFNPTTNIDFSIKSPSRVKIELYNSIGQYLSTITDADFSIGTYTIPFNGSNLASGIFYYRITAGTFSQVKGMIHVK